MTRPEFDPLILEAIAVLTGRTEGDVFYKVESGGFNGLALEALTEFTRKYHLMERKGDSAPIDDLTILQHCLEELKKDLPLAQNSRERREITQDIEGLKERIKIAKNS
jgi:hypothetical protein